MSYALTSVAAIKSPSQHALVCLWDRLAAGRRLPAITDFSLPPDLHDVTRLVVWNVEGKGRLLTFRAAYQGEAVAEVFASAWSGKTMNEIVPISLRRFAIEAAKECATSGCPVYTIVSTIDIHGRCIDCERLLLPFAAGPRVQQILASLQLTRVAGGVRRNRILASFQIDSRLVFSGRIEPGFTIGEPAEATNDSGPRVTGPVTEHRRASRRVVKRAGRIQFANKVRTCIVRNISTTGALIEGAKIVEAPDSFTLTLEMESMERPCAVVWRRKTQLGVRFISPRP